QIEASICSWRATDSDVQISARRCVAWSLLGPPYATHDNEGVRALVPRYTTASPPAYACFVPPPLLSLAYLFCAECEEKRCASGYARSGDGREKSRTERGRLRSGSRDDDVWRRASQRRGRARLRAGVSGGSDGERKRAGEARLPCGECELRRDATLGRDGGVRVEAKRVRVCVRGAWARPAAMGNWRRIARGLRAWGAGGRRRCPTDTQELKPGWVRVGDGAGGGDAQRISRCGGACRAAPFACAGGGWGSDAHARRVGGGAYAWGTTRPRTGRGQATRLGSDTCGAGLRAWRRLSVIRACEDYREPASLKRGGRRACTLLWDGVRPSRDASCTGPRSSQGGVHYSRITMIVDALCPR
ncbi:hypothetical protein DFH06DRAFT_1395789, partial [Mycena polygramma]